MPLHSGQICTLMCSPSVLPWPHHVLCAHAVFSTERERALWGHGELAMARTAAHVRHRATAHRRTARALGTQKDDFSMARVRSQRTSAYYM
jgi:hypothetical protein